MAFHYSAKQTWFWGKIIFISALKIYIFAFKICISTVGMFISRREMDFLGYISSIYYYIKNACNPRYHGMQAFLKYMYRWFRSVLGL